MSIRKLRTEFEKHNWSLDYLWKDNTLAPIDNPIDTWAHSEVWDNERQVLEEMGFENDGAWILKTSEIDDSWQLRIHGPGYGEYAYFADFDFDINSSIRIWFSNHAQLLSFLMAAAPLIECSRHAEWIEAKRTKVESETNEPTVVNPA